MKNIQISPSILSADFSQLGSEIKRLEEGGADMIEIGIPFSDPQADGPIIQRASEIALSNGISLSIIFDQVRSIRKKTDILELEAPKSIQTTPICISSSRRLDCPET